MSQLTSATPLAFPLICKDTTLDTLGDAVRLLGELTPDERDEFCWHIAGHMVNTAIKEPRYIKAATITLQTALTLNRMLAPETP